MDPIVSFTIETGGQKCHVMWILTNQQAAWWCNALQLPSEKMLWNPSIGTQHPLFPTTTFWHHNHWATLLKLYTKEECCVCGGVRIIFGNLSGDCLPEKTRQPTCDWSSHRIQLIVHLFIRQTTQALHHKMNIAIFDHFHFNPSVRLLCTQVTMVIK